MFNNNKIVKITGYVIGGYLLLKIVLTVVMYIWALFQVPPVPMINPEAPGALLTLLDTVAIFAIEILAVGILVKYMISPIKCPTCPPCTCPTKRAPAKKPARKSKK